ncbi:ABC transporter permease [Alkalihalobacillus pseudalcaliphilus]|uniref:ABC transporter permease n=1 Tax=Alkalihalobacillus pseudalcaliphilus TaxID=79884 RepID=UPI00064D959F|nr:ABC transporter permease [Alkalihalobacillus pseudalcaliphilus]KMK74427.1 hypothetical protein AB990_21200 [Alkalihalobacillus pseudalcaliphilus]
MLKLISLELKRNNFRTYVMASLITFLILLVFTYFVAYVAQVESGAYEIQFHNYTNIFRFTGTISLIIFSIMSAVIYSRLIISEYKGKRVALLFSYPISRRKILLAKLLLVVMFTSISMLICTSIPYIVFSITESISPIVLQDVMSKEIVISTLQMLAMAILAVGGIGIVSMRIGFIKKSIPTTLITAFILSATYGNAVISTNHVLSGLFICGIGIIVTVFIMTELSNKVDEMEVE